MKNKTIGSIFIIFGTAVGAGMLALPVATAHASYTMTVMMMLISWLAMTLGAFALLEVNLWMKPGSNIITMANATLGKVGKWATWILYLLLFYSLLCAYISGCGDVLQSLFLTLHVHLPRWAATLFIVFIVAIIVYQGISSIDFVNRGLVILKFIAFFVLIGAITPHIKLHYMFTEAYQWRGSTLMVMLTSFGFAVIVPSLRSYLEGSTIKLKKAILIGSILPLILYLIWIAVIQGFIPRTGSFGLLHIAQSSHTNSLLIGSISHLIHYPWMGSIARLFVTVCIITSFLGVSLGLTDFISDGLHIKKQGKEGIIVQGLTYLPSLIIVLLAPGIFIKALGYAGICCVLLLILLPLLMLYSGRYVKSFSGERIVFGGPWIIYLGVIFSVIVLLMNVSFG